MYSSFQIIKKYIHYYFTASNGSGHGIHSPFVFNFIRFVLKDKKEYSCYKEIESLRKSLLRNKKVIEVTDFGAGSGILKTNKRIVRQIAASSLKPKKFSQLLFRIVQYYQPANIIELGTSFGITTAYLASGNKNASVYTLEGAATIAEIANENFKQLRLKNIKPVGGDFKTTLPQVLSAITNTDLVFVDGNHRKAPTMEYLSQLLKSSKPATILIFDDIHWSREMEEAWLAIQQHKQVTLTVDLFFIGLVFINPDFKIRQHFKIRF